MSNSKVYEYPAYYALGYRWNTEAECEFIEAYLKRHGRDGGGRLLDIGCGAGRHALYLAQRGYEVTGVDLSAAMVEYVKAAAEERQLPVTAAVGDLRDLQVAGRFEAAYCFMDTFRFLLTNEEIVKHLRTVGDLLEPGGLYFVDLWVPRAWDKIGEEIFQWEQTEAGRTVRVFYVQHPESIDPIGQTFEDELVFEVEQDGQTELIRGGRTRTRLIMPQELRALVEQSGALHWVAAHGEFDPGKPLTPETFSWRMIAVLAKR